jgi:restriction system protein
MPIPDYQTVMKPLLEAIKDETEHTLSSLVSQIANVFNLTDDEVQQLLPSGTIRVINSRVGWAKTYLKNAGLLVQPRRGTVRVTREGLALLAENPPKIDSKFLERYESFRKFKERRNEIVEGNPSYGNSTLIETVATDEPPQEIMANAYKRLRDEIENELLLQLKQSSPEFFERVVVDLMLAMGYGGSRSEAGRAVGRNGDGGIDGVINEDRLGLDVIYLQAKRWEGTVGRPEVQKFAGALQGQRANKGVFITTSTFTKEATEYAEKISTKIVLVDGRLLCAHMFDYGIGVARFGTFEIKRIDSDYFESIDN